MVRATAPGKFWPRCRTSTPTSGCSCSREIWEKARPFGVAYRRPRVILYSSDADLEYDPADYPNLLDPLTQGKADVVYGSRFLGSRRHRVLASGAKTPSNDRALPLSAIILTFFGKEGITSFENVVRCSQHVTGVLAGIHIFRKRQAQEHLMIAVWLEE